MKNLMPWGEDRLFAWVHPSCVCVCGGWRRGADAKMIIPATTVIEREARRSQRTERVPVLSGPGDDLTRGGGMTEAIQRTRRRNFPAGPHSESPWLWSLHQAASPGPPTSPRDIAVTGRAS